MNLIIEYESIEKIILTMIFIGIVVPVVLFLIGFVQLKINKRRGKIILIIAAMYSIISFGLCGGFGV